MLNINKNTTDNFIYFLKLIAYFDTFELDKEYEQRGGAQGEGAGAGAVPQGEGAGAGAVPQAPASLAGSGEKAPEVKADQGTNVDGVDVGSDNNFFVYVTKVGLKTVRRFSVYMGNMFGKYAMLFIFAATFPALPFFACMGFMYATIKYAMFKFRGL